MRLAKRVYNNLLTRKSEHLRVNQTQSQFLHSKIVIESDLCAKVRFFELMNVSWRK